MNTYSKLRENTSKLYQDIHINYPISDLKKYADQFTSFLQLPSGYFVNKVCLDAGCGGTSRGIYSLLYNGSKFVYGIDFSKELLDITKNHLNKFAGKFKLIKRDILEINNIDDKTQLFDFIFCEGVLHHTSNPKKGFSNLVALLKPGGKIYVGVYGKGFGIWPIIITPLLRLLGRIIPYKQTKHFVNYTKIGQSIYCSLLDDMYVPIRKSYKPREIINWYQKNNLVNIKRLEKYALIKETSFYKRMKKKLFILRQRIKYGHGSISVIGQKPI